MTRHSYQNPPVFEVTLEIRLAEPLKDVRVRLESIASPFAALFEHRAEQQTVNLPIQLSGQSVQQLVPVREFSGFEYTSKDPGWTCRLRGDLFSLHMTRRGPWIDGEYHGWEAFAAMLKTILDAGHGLYSEQPLSRAGLRYVNKIAIPTDESAPNLADWFAIESQTVNELGSGTAFDLRRTLQKLRGYDDLNASVRLASIKIADDELASEAFGVLLDIDVFSGAPLFDDVLAWAERAHRAENDLFEACIADRLRDSFRLEEK